MRYDRMVEKALRSVVRDALLYVAEHGLPGEHHFFLTFNTRQPGVQLPAYLHERYAEEMTIVLQYQFYGLEIHEDWFAVTLSFSNKHERLVIPFAAVTTFADPSVSFALQFQPPPVADDEEPATPAAPSEPQEIAPKPERPAAVSKDDDAEKVVALDRFRKK